MIRSLLTHTIWGDPNLSLQSINQVRIYNNHDMQNKIQQVLNFTTLK